MHFNLSYFYALYANNPQSNFIISLIEAQSLYWRSTTTRQVRNKYSLKFQTFVLLLKIFSVSAQTAHLSQHRSSGQAHDFTQHNSIHINKKNSNSFKQSTLQNQERE